MYAFLEKNVDYFDDLWDKSWNDKNLVGIEAKTFG